MVSTSPHFPQRKMHTLVRSKKHYLQRREWQPISIHHDRPFYLSLGLSLVPLLPHPAFTINHKQMRALIWVLEKLYHLFPVELKRYFLILCPQMTGWTLLNYEGKWGRCWLGKPWDHTCHLANLSLLPQTLLGIFCQWPPAQAWHNPKVFWPKYSAQERKFLCTWFTSSQAGHLNLLMSPLDLFLL